MDCISNPSFIKQFAPISVKPVGNWFCPLSGKEREW